MNRRTQTFALSRGGLALALALATATATATAAADPEPREPRPASPGGTPARHASPSGPPDVVVRDAPTPDRILVIEWNPLALLAISRLSANAIIAPVDHHALVLSAFYASTTTVPIYIKDDGGNPTRLPEQKFSGFGFELGYRYYRDEGGPRGLFLGPSLILGSFAAKAEDGSKTSYLDYGLAADVGYQMLVADRVALSLGGGLQYIATSKSIPQQQFPAWIYANSRVSPRVLFSLGWAF